MFIVYIYVYKYLCSNMSWLMRFELIVYNTQSTVHNTLITFGYKQKQKKKEKTLANKAANMSQSSTVIIVMFLWHWKSLLSTLPLCDRCAIQIIINKLFHHFANYYKSYNCLDVTIGSRLNGKLNISERLITIPVLRQSHAIPFHSIPLLFTKISNT